MIKQETLKEATEKYKNYYEVNAFNDGVRWQRERDYSEEEVLILLEDRSFHCCGATKMSYITTKEWFKQFKK